MVFNIEEIKLEEITELNNAKEIIATIIADMKVLQYNLTSAEASNDMLKTQWKELSDNSAEEVKKARLEAKKGLTNVRNPEQLRKALEEIKQVSLTKEDYEKLKKWEKKFKTEKEKNDSHVCSGPTPTDLPDNWKDELNRISQLENDLALAQINQKPVDLPSNWEDYLTRPDIPITEAEWNDDWSKRSKGSTLTPEQLTKLGDYDELEKRLSKNIKDLETKIKTMEDVLTNVLGLNLVDPNWRNNLINKLSGAKLTEIPSSQTLKDLLENNPKDFIEKINLLEQKTEDLEKNLAKEKFINRIMLDQAVREAGGVENWQNNNDYIEELTEKWEKKWEEEGIDYKPQLHYYIEEFKK